MEPTGAAPLRPTDLREIGPYRLLGRLGEGGMGTVFLARAPTGRFVAVKVIKAEFANTEGFAARFHAEVENARRVASFCTAQVLDNGNTGDDRPYMVTEYIGGTPLSDQITKYGALDPGPLHGVALGVAAALAAIHVAGLVHRDLKPANVILSISGPRVIDFGIARALDRETNFTVSGELLGSPGWWAPEQVRGLAVTPAADIFAWGCLIAYAGNGRHPFGRGDPITLATRVLNNPPELGALPAPLDELVRRATDMDPAQRPTAQDLLISLVGGSTSAPVPVADPPTLVANELLNEWEPPQNVVDKPDITATFATPPPSDTTAKAAAKRQADEAALYEAARVQEEATREAEPGRQANPTRPAERTGPTPQDHRPEPQDPAASFQPGQHTAPDHRLDIDDTLPPYRRSLSTRWLIAAAAAVLAIAVTVGVLIVTTSRNGPAAVQATGGPAPSASARPNDVGRRFTMGNAFDAPQVIVASAPECGLKQYGEQTQSQGQLCVVRWTMFNPGGERSEIGNPVVSLLDDKGGRHDPVEPAFPAALVPGERVDSAFVFDMPLLRTPVRLTVTNLKGGAQLEVRL